MKAKVTVTQDKLLLTELAAPKKTHSGRLFVPENIDESQSKTLRCRVLAIGPGQVHVTPTGKRVRVTVDEILGTKVRVGDVVAVLRFSHTHEVPGAQGVRVVAAKEVMWVERV